MHPITISTGNARSRGVCVRGDLLRHLREAHGWSQEMAASHANISVKVVRKAEEGEPIDVSSVAALASLYSSATAPLCPEDLIAGPFREQQVQALRSEGKRMACNLMTATWNGGDLEVIDGLVSDAVQFHCESGTFNSPAEIRRRMERIRQSFSDFKLTIDSISESAGTFAARWQVTMTHSGSWLGLSPTGRSINAIGVTSIRLEAGKIREGWEFWDPQTAFFELAQRAPGSNQFIQKNG